MSDATRWCTGCETTKPLSDFPCDRRKPDGRRSRCRVCTNARQREFQLAFKAKHGVWYSTTFVYERTCEVCGAVWSTRTKNARYCSVSCTNKLRRYERTCERCGVTWTSNRNTARFCTPACARASEVSFEIQPWRREPWWARRTWWLLLPPPQPRRWYAGNCRRCNASFVSNQPSNKYCSTPCGRADAKARRRARKKDAYISDVKRMEIFERDKWTCQLCHRKVNKQATVPHPKAPVLDHIIPLDDDGTHEPANVQCAHFLCNSIKGARGGGEQLLLIG